MSVGTVCVSCRRPIEVGHTIVGMPVIRIVEIGKSQLAGTELIFHVQCFVEKMKSNSVALELLDA